MSETALVFEDIQAIEARYREVPHTKVASNEPYATPKDDPESSAERQAAMEAFIAGDQEWPNIPLPALDKPPLDQSEKSYWSVLGDVMRYERQMGETPESALLYERAARKLAEVYRHKEVRRLLGTVAVDRAELSRERAGMMNEELFGEPDPVAFKVTLAADLRRALDVLQDTDNPRSQTAIEYLDLLGFSPQQAEQYAEDVPAEKTYELEDATIEVIRGDIYTLYPDLATEMAPYTNRNEETDPVDAEPAFEAALRGFGLAQKGWTVGVLSGSQAAETKGANSKITYGRKRSPFSKTGIFAVPMHEAIHGVRYQNGQEQDESYRRGAMPGSLAADEGIPTVVEQIMTGIKRIPGEKYNLQLGLFKGIHLQESEQHEQSFRKVYEIMVRRAALQGATPPSESKWASLQAANYRSVLRTARGSARDSRDMSYLLGARQAAIFFNQTAKIADPELRLRRLRWALSGVFDPTNPEHAAFYGGDPLESTGY